MHLIEDVNEWKSKVGQTRQIGQDIFMAQAIHSPKKKS